MAEQSQVVVVVNLRDIPPGTPHTRCYQILQDALEGQQFSSPSGDLNFTVTVEGFGSEAEVRCFPLSRTIR
jgi:hypothetical protein